MLGFFAKVPGEGSGRGKLADLTDGCNETWEAFALAFLRWSGYERSDLSFLFPRKRSKMEIFLDVLGEEAEASRDISLKELGVGLDGRGIRLARELSATLSAEGYGCSRRTL